MKKSYLLLFCLLLASGVAFSQNKDKKIKTKKLSRDEAASLTPEQRLAHESARKSKGGKKKMSTKQKVKIQKKQSRAAEHVKPPRPKVKSRPKD